MSILKGRLMCAILLIYSAFLPVSFFAYCGESEYAVRTIKESKLFNIQYRAPYPGGHLPGQVSWYYHQQLLSRISH